MKLKIGFIGLGQRGAAYGMTDGSIGLLGNVLKNSDDVIVTVICGKFQERLDAASEKIVAHGYNKEELKKLIQMTKGKLLEFPVVMASYYGLRRSENAGLKWSAVDFNYKTITIMHTAVYCPVDGKA